MDIAKQTYTVSGNQAVVRIIVHYMLILPTSGTIFVPETSKWRCLGTIYEKK